MGEEAKYCNAIMAFIINNANTKLPIKGSELLEIVDKNHSAYKTALVSARQALVTTYGIYFKEVPDSKIKKFIAYTDVPAQSLKEYDPQQQRELTLLFIILVFLFMTGHPVEEEVLQSFLYELDISFEVDHSFFGPVKKLVTETFVRQLYLKREKYNMEASSETRYKYSWGFRSTLEFEKKQLLEEAAEILKRPKDFFIAQCKEIADEEGQTQDSMVIN